METITSTKLHKTHATIKRCDTCGTFATHSILDLKEIPSSDGVYREFEPVGMRNGCAKHSVVSLTTYLDGRVIATALCVPETVCPQEKQ